MPHPHSSASEQFWIHRANLLALRLNFHHWLARLIPKLAVLLVGTALFDVFRREIGLPARWGVALLIFGTAVVAAWAWLQARKHFCAPGQALTRLETVLGLHNKLSAASAGVIPWPKPPAQIDDGYAPNWNQIALPVLAGTLFLWCAHLMPVHRMKLGADSSPISEPPELAQVQNWINALKAEDMIEPEKLQDMQNALDKLRDRPPQDWYTQGNLEAANSLKELTEQSMNSLAQDLSQADQSVEAMKEKADNASDTTSLQPMQDQLRGAAENLASGNLPLNRELVQQLKNGVSPTDKPLTGKQLEELHEKLAKGQAAAQTAPKSNMPMSDEMQKAMAAAGSGTGMGRRELSPGGPNSGGLGGGKKSAPLELQARDKTTPDGSLTAVNSDDMSRVSIALRFTSIFKRKRSSCASGRGELHCAAGRRHAHAPEPRHQVWRESPRGPGAGGGGALAGTVAGAAEREHRRRACRSATNLATPDHSRLQRAA